MYSRFFSSVTPPLLKYSTVISLANVEEASTRLHLESTWGFDGLATKSRSGKSLEDLHSALKRHKYIFRPRKKVVHSLRSFLDGENPLVQDKRFMHERIFSFPSESDKIVLTALAQKIEDIWDPFFVNSSYGFRKTKNWHDFLRDIQEKHATLRSPLFLQIHLSKEFGIAQQKVLIHSLKQFCDQQIVDLFHVIFRSHYIDIHNLSNRQAYFSFSSSASFPAFPFLEKKERKDIPFTNSLSSVCTNLFFHPFDLFLTRLQKKIPFFFFRAADQILLFMDQRGGQEDEQILENLETEIQRYLKQKLFLSSRIERVRKVSLGGTILQTISSSDEFLSPDIEFLHSQALQGNFARYQRTGKLRPTSCRQVTSLPESEIVKMYGKIVSGLLTYYSWCSEKKSLFRVLDLYKKSCALTLAEKFRLGSARKVYKRFGPSLHIRSSNARKSVSFPVYETRHSPFFSCGRREINEENLLHKPQMWRSSFSSFSTKSLDGKPYAKVWDHSNEDVPFARTV
uniref:Putative reverse transcriptase and intron maturase n=1 Tax=Prasinococcus sp. CCMP1194 TaxID=110672 RepID=A0A650AKN0_9VIRI|nr:putative reverse transcriptase and intron maturase [Prasinococcus sp. CCMP1194]